MNDIKKADTELSSLVETLYLLRSPANAARLTSALKRAKSNTVEPQTINELYQRFGFEETKNDGLTDELINRGNSGGLQDTRDVLK